MDVVSRQNGFIAPSDWPAPPHPAEQATGSRDFVTATLGSWDAWSPASAPGPRR